MQRSRTSPVILLVEDYLDSRQMLKLLLESLGYRVLTAVNGQNALTIASNETLDLVLTDFDLPDMTGATMVSNLRRLNDRLINVPFIVITAYDGEEYRSLSNQAGCSAFLNKPIDFELLANTMSQVLQESNQSPNARQRNQLSSLDGNEKVKVDPLPTSL